MTQRTVRLDGTGDYTSFTAARAAAIAAGTADVFRATQPGTYPAENWAAQVPAGCRAEASVDDVDVSFVNGASPLWLPHNGETCDRLGLAFDNSHGYSISVRSKTGVVFTRCRFVPLAAGLGINRAFVDTNGTGAVIVDGLTIDGNPGNGYLLGYNAGGSITIQNIDDRSAWQWWSLYYNALAGAQAVASRVRAKVYQTAFQYPTSGALTIRDVLTPAAIFGPGIHTTGAANLALDVAGYGAPSSQCIWQASSGTLSGSVVNSYGSRLIRLFTGAVTATGGNNCYASTNAAAHADDWPGVSGAGWRLGPDYTPDRDSPLLERGQYVAGRIYDVYGNPATQGHRPCIGPIQPQYQIRDTRTGRNLSRIGQARAA